MSAQITAIAAALGLRERDCRELRAGEVVADVSLPDLNPTADAIVGALRGRLISLFATDERTHRGCFVVHHLWSLPGSQTFLRVTAPVDPHRLAFPSIAARHPAANWFEREVMDFFGLRPEGHPNPERVSLHDDWPEGVRPLRKDFDPETVVPRAGHVQPGRRLGPHRLLSEQLGQVVVHLQQRGTLARL